MKTTLLSIVFILFTVQFVSAQQSVNPATSSPTSFADIRFDKTTHDYGTIYQGGDGNCVFKFTNTGKEPLVLSSVKSSCGCTVPKWTSEPILPGKTGEILVTYDSNRLGTIAKQITVISNAQTSTIVLNIQGQIIQKPENSQTN